MTKKMNEKVTQPHKDDTSQQQHFYFLDDRFMKTKKRTHTVMLPNAAVLLEPRIEKGAENKKKKKRQVTYNKSC